MHDLQQLISSCPPVVMLNEVRILKKKNEFNIPIRQLTFVLRRKL